MSCDGLDPQFLTFKCLSANLPLGFDWPSDGISMDSQDVNNLLAHTSKVAGFARAVTTHNFRHMMARTLRRGGLSLIEIQMALGHRWFGQVTKLYWGNHS